MKAELEQNCLALQAVGASMRSLLGPLNCLKFHIGEESHDSGVLLEPIQVIEALSSAGGLQYGHPTNQLLYESCRGQQKECGCGVTTLVCLSAFWSEGVIRLVEEGIPLPVVFSLFDEGLRLCQPLFSSQATPIESLSLRPCKNDHSSSTSSVECRRSNEKSVWSHDTGNPPILKSVPSHDTSIPPKLKAGNYSKVKLYSRHLSSSQPPSHVTTPTTSHESHMTREALSLLSSGLAHGREQAMDLVGVAVERVWSQKGGPLDMSSILTHCVVGKGQSSSRVVDGVLVDLRSEMTSLFQQQLSGDLHIAVVGGDCTPNSTHLGFHRKSHMASHDLLYDQPTSSQWLSQCASVLDKFNVGLVVVGGVMSPLLWEHCLATGVVALTGVAQRQRDTICCISGATPTCYLQHIKQSHIGGGVCVELVEGGWAIPRVVYNETTQRHPIKTYSCHISSSRTQRPVVTAMLCGSTEATVNLLLQSFQNSLHRLNCALADNHVLPGGGAFEAICVHTLRQAAVKTKPLTLSESDPTSSNWMFDSRLLGEWRPAVLGAMADGLLKYVATVVGNRTVGADCHTALAEAERMVCEGVESGCEGVRVFDDVRSKRSAWGRAVELVRTVCSVGVIRQ